jgi:GcrA cell cycle regulator
MSVWTGERIELLKTLWAAGETAPAIAARLGMSRSAVLGKIFRLRLPPVPGAPAGQGQPDVAAPVRRHRVRRNKVRRRRARRAKPPAPAAATTKMTAPAKMAAPPKPPGKSLFELTNRCCRWPFGRPGTKNFYFCGADGADVAGDKPYCDEHMRRAYVAGKKPKSSMAEMLLRIPLPPTAPAAAVPRRRFVFARSKRS